MKLVFKFALWYLVSTLLALAIGGVISYREIKEEVDFEQSHYLKGKMELAARRIGRGVHPDSLSRHNMEIRLLDPSKPLMKTHMTDRLFMHKFMQRQEHQIKVSDTYTVDGQHNYIR